MTIYNSVLDVIGNTPIVRINKLFSDFPSAQVLAKLDFLNPGGSKKDRIALKMIERAEAAGQIKPGDTLVEPTSGNTGTGLALVAAVKGYKMVITMPAKMSDEKRRMLKALGAELIITPTEYGFDHPDGYIELAKRIARERPNAHILDQYANAGNPLAHCENTGPEIWEQTGGTITHFVAGMGTGGTITGVGAFLKSKNPDIRTIGADPEGSIFTGNVAPYKVEGIGYDFFPDVFKPDGVDTMYRVSDADSFKWARRLAKEEGIVAGGSTGTVLEATHRLLTQLKDDNAIDGTVIVIMVHDTGRTYLSKIYNDDWMVANGFSIDDDTRNTDNP